jgi:uncharacterized protein
MQTKRLNPNEQVANVPLGPTLERERIHVLDLIRAIALLGIFLVNVEFFNRQLGERGLPLHATGADRIVGAVIYYIIEGKAWILFAFLFGLGMAMTTMRSSQGEQPNLRPYLRRVAGLAIFGAIHCIFIWRGDILFLYAIAALGLLVALYCKTRYAILAVIAAIALGILTGVDTQASYGQCILVLGLAGVYIQNKWRFVVKGLQLDPISTLFFAVALALLIVTIGNGMEKGFSSIPPMIPIRVCCFALVGVIAIKFRDDREGRLLWSAIGLYCIPLALSMGNGLVQYAKALNQEPSKHAQVATPQPPSSAVNEETKLLTSGTYPQILAWRTRFFVRNAFSEAALVTPTVAIFLLGVWFVRTGAIATIVIGSRATTKWTCLLLLFGYGLTSFGKYMEQMDITSPVPGIARIALGLNGLGSLSASIGIVLGMISIFGREGFHSRVQFLLPVGRLALTNYLLQSIACSCFFYGYGMGNWGLGRIGQVGFVAVVFFLQIVFSNLWLSRFSMGPCEWCLRVITYWRLCPLVRGGTQAVGLG